MVGCSTAAEKCAAYAEDNNQTNSQVLTRQKEMPKCDNKKCEICYPKNYLKNN